MWDLWILWWEREGGSEGGKVFRGETGSKLCFKGIPRYEALRLWKGKSRHRDQLRGWWRLGGGDGIQSWASMVAREVGRSSQVWAIFWRQSQQVLLVGWIHKHSWEQEKWNSGCLQEFEPENPEAWGCHLLSGPTVREEQGFFFFSEKGQVRHSLDLIPKSFGPKELLSTCWQSSGKGVGVRAKPWSEQIVPPETREFRTL